MEDSRPSGHVGHETGRDSKTGRFVRGNQAALIAGAHSRRFWLEQRDARRELEVEILADSAFTPDDAPRALRIAVEGLAQATLVGASAINCYSGGQKLVPDRGGRQLGRHGARDRADADYYE